LSLHRSGTWESVCWCKRLYPAVPGSNSFITPGRPSDRLAARTLFVCQLSPRHSLKCL
jgi:hypothetical protein